jgi:hypothetical protein
MGTKAVFCRDLRLPAQGKFPPGDRYAGRRQDVRVQCALCTEERVFKKWEMACEQEIVVWRCRCRKYLQQKNVRCKM